MITVLKNKPRNEVDSGVDLEAVGVVSKDATREVVAVLEVLDMTRVAIGVDVGTMMVIGVDVGATVVIEVVAEVVVVLEAVAAVVVEVVIEVVLMVEDPGVETIEIATDQENLGETMIEEVLGVVSIKGNHSIYRHHLKIKKSLSTINTK